MKNPKELFESGEHGKAWADLTASDMWAEACSSASAMMAQLAVSGDPTSGSKLVGARMIVNILTNLATPNAPMQVEQPKLKY